MTAAATTGPARGPCPPEENGGRRKHRAGQEGRAPPHPHQQCAESLSAIILFQNQYLPCMTSDLKLINESEMNLTLAKRISFTQSETHPNVSERGLKPDAYTVTVFEMLSGSVSFDVILREKIIT